MRSSIFETVGASEAYALLASLLAGELRHIHKLRFWGLPSVLHEKYRFPMPVAEEIANFILPMIDINPEKRATAKEMLESDWLKDVEISDDEENDSEVERGRFEADEATSARKEEEGATVGHGVELLLA